ncbi:hypothetical protein B488_10010 [Liberibacter crescens BT-1]|uniref:Uncharacterized protein n=1 Tax=Liberibacter crescens (strain BT-1) TaxID=1215343 RepID=L0EWH9_LIBCB|nr:hypothetical protein [Liberibacter crescens]AGA64993.1 hypothetical protein B488_10010 [Liberibacter crescens BT-1]AMC13008.1 hypothetical protein RL73_05095 [Liberibacter crescens]
MGKVFLKSTVHIGCDINLECKGLKYIDRRIKIIAGDCNIEDLHCSYLKDYKGSLTDKSSSMNFLKSLSDIINHDHWNANYSRAEFINKNFLKDTDLVIKEQTLAQINSISFSNSLYIIEKKPQTKNYSVTQ